MNLTEKYFLERFGGLVMLMGWNASMARQIYIYGEIQEFDSDDFDIAIEKLKEVERFSFPQFRRSLDEARSGRLEQEARNRREREERETRVWWENRQAPSSEENCEETDGVRPCIDCGVERCDVIAHAVLAGIKDMVSGRRSSAEVEEAMGRKFPGTGWKSPVEPF